jgi:undecaprenyl diphosphate synthase
MFRFFEEQERNVLRRGEIPAHIAVIMDGNGTWAKRRGLPRTAGHAQGARALRKVLQESARLGVRYLTVYAFSTENWKRPKSEVDYLMQLFMESMQKEVPDLIKNKVQLRFLGDLSAFSAELSAMMQDSMKKTDVAKPRVTLNVMINYGARNELYRAMKKITEQKKILKDENDLGNYLDTAGLPDPDLLIRTSGQLRISNFLLWQSAYTEFWFTDKCWPDFNGSVLRTAVREYQRRHRRRGGL